MHEINFGSLATSKAASGMDFGKLVQHFSSDKICRVIPSSEHDIGTSIRKLTPFLKRIQFVIICGVENVTSVGEWWIL